MFTGGEQQIVKNWIIMHYYNFLLLSIFSGQLAVLPRVVCAKMFANISVNHKKKEWAKNSLKFELLNNNNHNKIQKLCLSNIFKIFWQ